MTIMEILTLNEITLELYGTELTVKQGRMSYTNTLENFDVIYNELFTFDFKLKLSDVEVKQVKEFLE